MVQSRQRFDKHVYTLIAILVATGGEEVECVLRVEVVVAVEMPAHKVVDLDLGLLVQILELVGGRELLHVQTVGQDTVRLSLQKMLALVCGDVGNRCKHISRVRSGALNAVAVVDTALSCLGVDVEVLEIVVEIDRAGAEVATEERGVGGEDGGNIDAALLAERDRDTCQPFVELDNDGSLLLMVDILEGS